MNTIKPVVLVLSFGMILLLAVFNGNAQAVIKKNALLIGISDYSHSNLHSLPGCRNDIEATRKTLIKSLGMDPERIIVLLDDQATHTGIINGMQKLNKQVSQGDFVYIHYSGHGSYMPDLNGDEPRGSDQTWVSFGARSSKNTVSQNLDDYDVLDDEISSLLAPIYQKAGQVVFISDSCHSGTVSRGDCPPLQRAAGVDGRMHPKGMLEFKQADFTKGILIGSTEDTQPACEIVQNGQHFGLFSWYWLQTLQHASPDSSWYELFRRTKIRIKAESNITQHPQISGNANVSIIGGQFVAQANTVNVTRIDGQTVTINAGAVAGITPGSIFVKKKGDSSTGRLSMLNVRDFSSNGTAKGSFKVGDQLFLEDRFYPRPVMQIFINGDIILPEKEKVLKQIRETVSTLPGAAIAPSQAQADVVLYYMRSAKDAVDSLHDATDTVNFRQTLPTGSPDGVPRVWFLKADESFFDNGLWVSWPENGNAQLLTNNLRHIRNAQTLKSLGNTGKARPPVNLEIVHMQSVDHCGGNTNNTCKEFPFGSFEVAPPVLSADFDGRNTNKGDVLSFNLANTSRIAQYVYLINIMSNGEIKTIYPTPDMTAEMHRLDKGERRDQIPVALSLDRAGTETVKIITATQPVDINLFEQAAYTSRGHCDKNENMNGLEQLILSRADHNTQTRGKLISFGSMSWSADNVDIRVKGKASSMQTGVRGEGDAGRTYVRVSVLFGCNRNYIAKTKKIGDCFGNDRGKLRLGRLWVSIPANHKPGELEAPALLSLRGEDPEKHLMLESVDFFTESEFTDAVKKAAKKVPENRVLLYVHGYNNSFELAARRTAQIAYDLSTAGISYVPLLFTWPSGNSIKPTQYTRAWTNKDWAVSDLVRFVQLAVDQTDLGNFHVLAHSMGTNLFATAAVHLAHTGSEIRKLFSQVIFAAPDIDAQTFYKLFLPNLDMVADRTTVYTASQDVALYVSRIVHSGYHRLGDSSQRLLVRQGPDLVDVSKVNTSDMGHAYYASIQKLIQDISLTVDGFEPEKRDLESAFSDSKHTYWKINNQDSERDSP